MSVNGPMAKTLDDIVLFSKTIVDAQPWLQDPKCLPIPWRPVEDKKSLKIAVLWNDGVVKPTPPVTRALKETVEKLKKAGHEIVEWNPVLHPKALQLLVSRSHSSMLHLLTVTFRVGCSWPMVERVCVPC